MPNVFGLEEERLVQAMANDIEGWFKKKKKKFLSWIGKRYRGDYG